MQIQNPTAAALRGRSFDRQVQSNLERLNAGVTVRPQDRPAAAASYQRSRAYQNALQTATDNLPRALAFVGAVSDTLGQAASVLDELRTLFVTDGADAQTAARVASLLTTLDGLNDGSFNGNALFTEPAAPVQPAPEPAGPRGVVTQATVEQTAREDTTEVAFGRALNDAVVIATLAPGGDPSPATARVTGVTETGATVQVQEFDFQDGVRGPESLNLLALEAGSYVLEDGRRLEVGTITTDGDVTRLTFESAFDTAPVVFTTIQSNNDPTAAVVRLDSVSATGVNVRVQQEEGLNRDDHGAETVGFIALEGGSFDLGGVTLTAVTSGDTFTDSIGTLAVPGGIPDDATVFAALQTTDGGDTAQTRVSAVTDTAVQLSVEEETSADNETRHTTERVAVLVASGGTTINVDPVAEPQRAAPSPRLATTGRLAAATNGLDTAPIDRHALGDASDSLAALTGDRLNVLTGDRSRAVEVIDAARGQVRRAGVRADAFARYELAAVDRVTRHSLAASRRDQIRQETAAGEAASRDLSQLHRRAAGLALAERVADFQNQQVVALITRATGGSPAPLASPARFTANQRSGQLAQVTEALARYAQAATQGDAPSPTLRNALPGFEARA